MVKDFIADHHLITVLYPVADAFAGGVDTDVVGMRDYRRATFFILTGAIEDAGISNIITCKACTDNAKTGAVAMAFRYRAQRSSTTVDTWGTFASAAAAGYDFAVNNAVANAIWMIEVSAEEVSAALADADFVYLSIAETANKTITAGAICVLSDPRYPQNIPPTAIA